MFSGFSKMRSAEFQINYLRGNVQAIPKPSKAKFSNFSIVKKVSDKAENA